MNTPPTPDRPDNGSDGTSGVGGTGTLDDLLGFGGRGGAGHGGAGGQNGTARERREARDRRRRTTRVAVVMTTVAVLALVGGGLAWYLVSESGSLTRQATTSRQLLASSAGQVTEPDARLELAAQVQRADAVLAEPMPDRFITLTSGLVTGLAPGEESMRGELATASDAVAASMLDFARDEVDEARAGLATVEDVGERTYEATKGKGTDEAVRARLRSALDAADESDTAAGELLGSGDLAQLEQAASDLGTYRSSVTAATRTLADAQDAITCPAPDQVWEPDSGLLPASELAPIPWSPTHRVRADVVDGLIELDNAFQKEFGTHLTINSSYRTYATQKELYDPSSPIAAPPGCSSHGLGLAVDIGGGVETFDTAPYTWLKANAQSYGWFHPPFAEPNGRVPEPWHWQSVLSRQSQ